MSPQFLKKFNRLRAMSMPELAYRVVNCIKDEFDKQRVLRGNVDSLELFMAQLNGEADSLDSTFRAIYAAFQKRQPFRWQTTPRDQLAAVYRTSFAENFESCREAAERYLQRTFFIFGLPLHFGESIDWHYDPLCKKSLPLVFWRDIDYYSKVVKEVKYIWELNRCQHFVTLAKLFYLTGEEKYVSVLFDHWTSWIKKNPYKMGINWTSSLECTFRIISWTWALYFVRESRQLNPGLYARFLQCIQLHAQFIEEHLSKYSSANNHLIGEALGLIYAGCYFPELTKAATWRHLGSQIVFCELLRQVHADGVSREQTTFYQKYVFDFGILTLLAEDDARIIVPPEVIDRLEKMAEFYAALLDQGGPLPNLGDEDGGEAVRLSDAEQNPFMTVLSTAAVLFNNQKCKAACPKISEATFWLLGESAIEDYKHVQAKKDSRLLVSYAAGGYVIMNQYTPVKQKLLFDCGPLGLAPMAAHGHADALAFTLSVDSLPVLIDSGTYLYLGAGEERDYFRSTQAHNTISVDDRSQSESLGPFQWGRRAECTLAKIIDDGETLLVQASHNGFRRQKIDHRRTIEARDGIWYCKDLISGVGNHKIDAYFHFAKSEMRRYEQSISAHFSTFIVELFFYRIALPCEEKIHILNAWHSESFGTREQHPVIQRQLLVNLPVELITRIKIYV